MSLSELTPEILCLIFKSLHSPDDLRKVCSVSKSFDILATPLLYRSVIFRRSGSTTKAWFQFPNDEGINGQDEADDLSFGIFYRLLDDRNKVLRAFVHRITVEDLNTSDSQLARHKLMGPQNLLARLVKKLPNLETVHFKRSVSLPPSEEFVEAFLTHKKSPKLFLLGESGSKTTEITMPFVHEIRTWFDATVSPSPENRRSWFQILNLDDPDAEPFEPERFALHELFSAYPNIESLSVSIDRFHGGCDGDPPSIRISSLAPGTTFPPLRSLSLSGYDVTKDEKGQRIWSKKFPWNQLQSLTLGHQDNPGFFKAATGKVRHLKKFEATHYGKPNSRRDLDAFLSSFHTLESLTAKGTIPSLAAMAHHSNLEHLCLHTIEQPDKERVSLNASEIRALNRKHPRLKSLELDIDPKGKWPDNIVKAIATGFKNLHQLSIHVGLRLPLLIKTCEADKTDDLLGFNDNYFKSVLTDETAQAFANRFFACRGPSAIKKITLQTGESLRWFPQWPPWYAESEGQHARTFEAYPPQHQGDEPCLKELMSDSEGVFPSSDSSEKKPQRLSRAPRVLRASGFPSVI